jgi:hypothetical protein
MAVYRPQYKDKKTGKMRHTKVWYYEFVFAGRLVKESAKTTSKTVAKAAEQARRRELEKGFNGLSDGRQDRIRNLGELARAFLADYQVRQPRSATFAEHAPGHVIRIIGVLMAVDVTDKTVVKYQTDRLKEGAAPKTVNDEVGFLLRILPVAQAGAIRAQLRSQKQLRLRSIKRVGKAYTAEEKAGLIKSAKSAPRRVAANWKKASMVCPMVVKSAGLDRFPTGTGGPTGTYCAKRVSVPNWQIPTSRPPLSTGPQNLRAILRERKRSSGRTCSTSSTSPRAYYAHCGMS